MSGLNIAAIGFLCLAVAHSALGEARYLSRLAAGVKAELPSALLILRSAWHALSLAWVAIALLLWDVSPALAVAVAAGVPGLLLLAFMPSHPAWGVMLIVSAAVLHSEGWVSPSLTAMAANLTGLVLLLISAWHLYWALGGMRGLAVALPSDADTQLPLLRPPKLVTAGVGLAIAGYAGAVMYSVTQPDHPVRWFVLAGICVFVARAIGDGRYVGLLKRVHNTRFAALDSRYFTPLVVLLALGSSAALL